MNSNKKSTHTSTFNHGETSYVSIIEAMASPSEVPLFDAQVRSAGCKRLDEIYQ